MNVRGVGIGAIGTPGIDRDGRDLLLIWAALSFDLPQPGSRAQPRLADAQPAPSAGPLWFGEPGISSAIWEAPIAYARPTSEVHLRADACAPEGTTVTELPVGARVGDCVQQAVVFGERRWTAVGDISPPLAFERLALVWEHAFGGASALDASVIETRNPIGLGIYSGLGEASERRLPFIEHPQQRIRSIRDRPEPVGFLPRGTGWDPRVRYAGTYDDAWIETRCPLWPLDFDERFFLAAPPALIAPRRFVGGEPVVLVGMHPRGELVFALPQARVSASCRFARRSLELDLDLDIVALDLIAGSLRLVFRATVVAHRELEDHVETVVEPQLSSSSMS